MIQILLCDDEKEALCFLSSLIEKYYSDYHCQIQAFTNASEAIKASNMCDICILDIDLPELNGIELAEQIKEKNKDMLILFYSCKDHLVFDSFKVHPFDFIRKSEPESDIIQKLHKAIHHAAQNKAHYIFTKGTETIILPYREILYFYKSLNDLNICTIHKEYIHRRPLKTLDYPQYFHKVSASLVVNFKYVKSFDDTQIFMTNNQYFRIGKQKMRDFKKHYFSYISSH